MNEFLGFPTGKKRKEVVAEQKKATAEFKKRGRQAILQSYSWRNSPLDDHGYYYGMGNKPFSYSFEYTLPEGREIKEYIETTLEARKGKAVGVEFGGVGVNLFGSFTPGFFAKSVGVTLIDHRYDDEKLAVLAEEDKRINHQVLEGDIFDPATYESLNKVLDNEKVDLIMERMAAGLEFVPIEPYTVSRILQGWYSMLRGGGV